MVELLNLEIKSKFRYLWLKYVTGVNLNVHCARCLNGEYSNLIDKEKQLTEKVELSEFPARIFYFCGVASPYNWENNFHLAFESANGESFLVDENGIKLEVINARRIMIDKSALNKVNHKNAAYRSYHTCRNWQFANYLELNQSLLS